MTMTTSRSVLARFFDGLKTVTARTPDPRAIVAQVGPLVRQLALAEGWLERKHYECDPEQGFGAHLLHEEPDHTLAVFVGSWLPGRGAPPHNHGTWAVVAGVEGTERNTFWVRVDDGARPGYAEIRKQREQVLGPGEVVTFQPDSIHSVVNESDRVSVSLHVYGTHINHTHRFQFDPDRRSAKAYIVKVDDPSGA
jgi:predicted metal-dependent enzyme (double-stranded beta helix superfamily)